MRAAMVSRCSLTIWSALAQGEPGGRLPHAAPVQQAPSWKQAGLLGWLFGTAWLCGTFWWLYISMHVYGGLPSVLAAIAVLGLAAFLSTYYAAACAIFMRLDGQSGIVRALLFAGLWTFAELARVTWFTGFPWGAGGYAHVDGPLSVLAPWVGVHGIGLAAALQYVGEIGLDRIAAYEQSLLDYAVGRLQEVEGLRFVGTAREKAAKFFRSHGQWVVFALRFSPFLRTMVSLPAGLSHMKLWRFLLFTTLGSVPWNLGLIYAGFLVGWNDWAATCGSAAAVAMVLGEYTGALVPALEERAVPVAMAVTVGFAALQWRGIRTAGTAQTVTSAAKAVVLLALVAACLLLPRLGPPMVPEPPRPGCAGYGDSSRPTWTRTPDLRCLFRVSPRPLRPSRRTYVVASAGAWNTSATSPRVMSGRSRISPLGPSGCSRP